jgi:hypothetical protein
MFAQTSWLSTVAQPVPLKAEVEVKVDDACPFAVLALGGAIVPCVAENATGVTGTVFGAVVPRSVPAEL